MIHPTKKVIDLINIIGDHIIFETSINPIDNPEHYFTGKIKLTNKKKRFKKETKIKIIKIPTDKFISDLLDETRNQTKSSNYFIDKAFRELTYNSAMYRSDEIFNLLFRSYISEKGFIIEIINPEKTANPFNLEEKLNWLNKKKYKILPKKLRTNKGYGLYLLTNPAFSVVYEDNFNTSAICDIPFDEDYRKQFQKIYSFIKKIKK